MYRYARYLSITFILLFLLSGFGALFAQKSQSSGVQDPSKAKFGSITLEDFDPKWHAFDSTADAVYLLDKGYASFRESTKGGFVLTFERHLRIKVLTKAGIDAANFSILQYRSSQSEEKLERLRGITFNVEGGKIVESKLSDKEVFKDQLDKNLFVSKFGMPNVKEGSIIDVSYSIASDFIYNLRSWDFQGRHPRLYTEYATSIPEFFVYQNYGNGYFNLERSEKTNTRTYNMVFSEGVGPTERGTLSGTETVTTWIGRQVPGLRREPFTTTVDNHISKIEFQLAEVRFPNQAPRPVTSSWSKLANDLLMSEDFGLGLFKNNGWLDADIKKITAGATTDLDKAKLLYYSWRDRFNHTSGNGKYLTDNPRNLWKNAKGNAADANLMLVTLLNAAGLNAAPVLLSTRNNGYANQFMPLLNQYNYVIAKLVVEGKNYYLDATDPILGFGYIPLECYNGMARLIEESGSKPESLPASIVRENKVTSITFFSDSAKPWNAKVSSRLGYYESHSLRGDVKTKGRDAIERDILNALPGESAVKGLELQQLKEYEKPVRVEYNVDMSAMGDEDIIYLNPLMGENTRENPFAAAERKYPVEMPYTFKEQIISNIYIPAGYVVDEMPKGTRVKLENDGGYFEYIIQQQDNLIQLRCTLEISQTNFPPEVYNSLREFFIYVVKKQSEQVVLRKK